MLNRKAYPTDVSDEEWVFVAPYLCLMREDAPQREHSSARGLQRLVLSGAGWLPLAASAQRLAALRGRFSAAGAALDQGGLL